MYQRSHFVTLAEIKSLYRGTSEVTITSWLTRSGSSASVDYTVPAEYMVTRLDLTYGEDSGCALTAIYDDATSAVLLNQQGYHGLHPDTSTSAYPIAGKRVARITGRVYSYNGKYNPCGNAYLIGTILKWR